MSYAVSLFSVEPSCSDDLLLHCPYDVDFDDTTCHHAKGYAYGDGKANIVNDPVRGNVVEFDGNCRIEVCIVYREPHYSYKLILGLICYMSIIINT